MNTTTGIDTSTTDTYVMPTRSWFTTYASYLVDANRGLVRDLTLNHQDMGNVVALGERYRLPPEAINYAIKRLREFAAADQGDAARILADAYKIRDAIREQARRELEGER